MLIIYADIDRREIGPGVSSRMVLDSRTPREFRNEQFWNSEFRSPSCVLFAGVEGC